MNIINALPGIVPTARNYTMGRWPQGRMKMRNGRVQRWGLCSIPSGDATSLEWKNITYQQAETLCIIWDNNYGLYGTETLPPEVFAGMGSDLGGFVALPFAGATWHFSGNPVVVPVKKGYCTVRIPISVRGLAVYTP